ncbi:MAG: DUF934 domain-containing protein [Paracoccus sp. (in: a-proteobacteria)]|uniref:DUF934 domain-containing protein n=1 Tax=Paracoccus sp. TaxID=267 RepID=UPI0026DEEAA2|nr:DUF934 domain-containing protein [Paracoccus sp. (in: a-proteobacteria)]MDO5620499.1 DUF934 domain-containing protein [Paracoccus sp. (in: a-proteobacteria)]
MSVIVTDKGFSPDDWTLGWGAEGQGVDLPHDSDPDGLTPELLAAPAIRIPFPSFADGRGFTLARSLRRQGFSGRLRASGHLLADQYAMARRVGFDEVEISDDLAARQPEKQWLARADWQANDYQARLRGSAASA